MWLFRPAHPDEATEACTVIRRSIQELCIADHGGDPAILHAWLASKTPERVRSWIEANPAGTLIGVGAGGIAGVGCVLPDGTIALNYVAPWAQRQGVGTGLLRAMEGVAAKAGHAVCTALPVARRGLPVGRCRLTPAAGGVCESRATPCRREPGCSPVADAAGARG